MTAGGDLHIKTHSDTIVNADTSGATVQITSSDGDVVINAHVTSPGSIVILAAKSVSINTNSYVKASPAATAGVLVIAQNGSITMDTGTYIDAAAGAIGLTATDGDVTLARLTTTGDVTITTTLSGGNLAGGITGSVLTAASTPINVQAHNLAITAAGSIGTSTNAITTDYTANADATPHAMGALSAGSGIWLTETTGSLILSTAVLGDR